MKDIIETEHKKIQLEGYWRSKFNELKTIFDGDAKSNKEQVMAEILSIKEKCESVQIFSLATEIDSWFKGDRVYARDEYITRQELERIIKNDDYYLNENHVHESFLDKMAFETILTPENLVDTWLLSGLPSLEACPWTTPPRYDYDNEQDCKDNPGNTRAIKVANLGKFLDKHNLPVPTAIFPNDATNTFYTLDRIKRAYANLVRRRKEEREHLELEKLRRENASPIPPHAITAGNDAIPVPQDAPEVEATPTLATGRTSDADGQRQANGGGKTPAELLAMHKADPVTWTRRRLAEVFCPLPKDAPYNSKKSWLHREFMKAKKG